MEKVKEFLKSPKKTAVLGLIGGILILVNCIMCSFKHFFVVDGLCSIGLIIYFVIIIVRIFLQKGNIKIANYTLIISYIVTLLIMIPNIQYMNIIDYAYVIPLIAIILYFFNILLKIRNFVNNKCFIIVTILYSFTHAYWLYVSCYTPINGTILYVIGFLLTIPYFYNYYELLKGENKNGK